MARQKQWKSPEKDAEKAKESPGADECFAEAIRLDPNCYLAFNACGVVAHAVGNTLTARHYFLKATKAKSDFVEGYASRGALNVYRNSVKAEQDFAEARRHAKKNEEPVLLSIGDGCVAYGRQQYAKARAIFAGAEIPKCLAALAGRNLAATELANLAFTADRTAHPGFSLQAALLHEEQQPPPPDKAAQPSDDEIESLIDRVESQDSKTIIVHTGGRLYCRRWISRHTPTCRWTAYRELPSLYRSADTPPAKPQSGTQFPVELLPNIPFLRISHSGKEAEVAEEFVQAAGVLMRLTAQIAQESRARPTAVPAEAPSVVVVPVAPADEPTMQKLGGAESDPRKVPVDYGRWGVCSVYGLLYAMPERAPKPQGPKG